MRRGAVRGWLATGGILGAVLAPALASGAPLGRPVAASIGSPNRGRLSGGVSLPRRAWLRVVPFYADADVRWGLPSLVGLVDRAGKRVAKRFRGSVLGVGDLSLEHGGEIDRHNSHESGRDADLAFFLVDERGEPLRLDRFAQVAPDGTVVGHPGARFDDARNWTLVQALLDDPVARVSHVFVAPHVRARLLAWASRRGERPDVLARAAGVLHQPKHALEHDDHFHVRVACPPGQSRTCREGPDARGVARAHALAARKASAPAPHPEAPALPALPSSAATDHDEEPDVDDEPVDAPRTHDP